MLEKYKVTSEEVNKSHVQSAPNRLTGTAQQNKMVFDKLPELLKDKINGIIVNLMGAGGADELGTTAVPGLSGSKLSEQISSIVTLLNDRYTKAEAEALANQETKNLVANVDVNLSNGVITVTKKDGTSKQYDTALEKVPAKFEFVQEDGAYKIKITNVDGSISKTDVTTLMNLYAFEDTSDIDFSVSGSGVEKTVTATVKAGSIGIDKLSLSAVSAIEGYVSSAATSAQSAEYAKNEAVTAKNEAVDARGQAETYKVETMNAANAAQQSETKARSSEKLSKSYAVGGTGARPDEATDNAKHYSEVARVEADRAKREADRASSIVGGDFATKTEVANAVQAETDNRVQAISEEAQARTQADESLQGKITSEIQVRTQKYSELQSQINTEKQTRQDTDNILQQNINNETAARQTADNKIVSKGSVHGLLAEKGGTLEVLFDGKWMAARAEVMESGLKSFVHEEATENLNLDEIEILHFKSERAGFYTLKRCENHPKGSSPRFGCAFVFRKSSNSGKTIMYIDPMSRCYVRSILGDSQWKRLDTSAGSSAPSSPLPHDEIYQVYE